MRGACTLAAYRYLVSGFRGAFEFGGDPLLKNEGGEFVNGCATGQGAPFWDLCFYGQNNDLRGYAAGQYRDHAMATLDD